MNRIFVTVGLPGSGKTTWARTKQVQNPKQNIVRINNDDIQKMLFGKSFVEIPNMSAALSHMRWDIMRSVFNNHITDTVILDNTNLSDFAKQEATKMANHFDAELIIQDFTHVPLDVCLEQNALRDNPVPEDVIVSMSWRYNVPKH
jgi:tRNA uridine 5-carbamoylmethylation protein Kti12